MHISSNNTSHYLGNFSKRICSKHFLHVNEKVFLYLSKKHDKLIFDLKESKGTVACMIPHEDFEVVTSSYAEFNELISDLPKTDSHVIWIGKEATHEDNLIKSKHIICHELKHIEQNFTDPLLMSANQLYESIKQTGNSPCNIDANNFADSVAYSTHNPYYNWQSEITSLIRSNKDFILEKKNEILSQEYDLDPHLKSILTKLSDSEIIGI